MSLRYKQIKEANKSWKKPKILKEMDPVYERPGRTKQSFKDSTDINKMLAKAQKAGTLSHLQKHGAYYGDFANAPTDLFEAKAMLDRGGEIFAELPSEIRNEFKNDQIEYWKFVNDPANKDRLAEVLPQIAKPGAFFPDVSPQTPPGALLGDTSTAVADTGDSSSTSDTGGGTPT